MPSLEQERAAFAWKCVQGCSSDYTNLAKSAPAFIMNNGLMQTLAFFESKSKDHHKNLNQHLLKWMAVRFSGQNGFPRGVQPLFGEMMKWMYEAPSEVYRRVTQETIELLRWIRQFAAAVNTK